MLKSILESFGKVLLAPPMGVLWSLVA